MSVHEEYHKTRAAIDKECDHHFHDHAHSISSCCKCNLATATYFADRAKFTGKGSVPGLDALVDMWLLNEIPTSEET